VVWGDLLASLEPLLSARALAKLKAALGGAQRLSVRGSGAAATSAMIV
jgi:hypothetical protein